MMPFSNSGYVRQHRGLPNIIEVCHVTFDNVASPSLRATMEGA